MSDPALPHVAIAPGKEGTAVVVKRPPSGSSFAPSGSASTPSGFLSTPSGSSYSSPVEKYG